MFSNVIFPVIRLRSLSAAVALVCFLSSASLAQDLMVPPTEGAAPPAAGATPVPANPVGDIGDGGAAMPTVPPPKVAKRDEPRNEEPMEELTEFYQRKVFAVPESRPGKTLTYFFKPPAAYQPQDKLYPLVIILHDEDGAAPAAQFLAQKAARKNFPAFIAVPVLPDGPVWAMPAKLDDNKKLAPKLKKEQALPDIVKLIPEIARDNPMVDLNRVYLVGCGDGGFGVFGAAAKFSHIFAGGVPISGGWNYREAPKLKNMPMFVMHGDSDKEVESAMSQNLAFYIQQSGGKKIAFLSIPGMGHDCANPYLYNNAVWAWLFKQRK